MRYASAYEYVFSMPTGEQMRVENQRQLDEQKASALALARERLLSASRLASSGLYEEAAEEFAQAIILDPEFYLARYQLGLLQFTQAKVAQALLTWAPLQNSQSSSKESGTLACFANGFRALAEDDIAGARSLFEEGLTRGHENRPLLQDVHKVLEALNSVEGNVSPVKFLSPETMETSKDAHILLSGYTQ